MRVTTAPGPTEARLADIGAAADELGYSVENFADDSVTVSDGSVRITIEVRRGYPLSITGDTLRRYIKESDRDWQAAVEANQ